jgi:hypothetical protein
MSNLFVPGMMVGRRSALAMLGSLGAVATLGETTRGATATGAAPAGAAAAKQRRGGAALDFDDPHDNLYAFGKIWSGYETPVIGGFHGLMYLRLPGRRMLPVFGFAGTGVSLAKFDPATGLTMKSRETGYFTDLQSGDVLEYWDNPLTGERCEVYHFYDDLLVGTLTTELPGTTRGDEPGAAPHPVMNEGTVFADKTGHFPFRMPFERFGADDLLLQWDYASAVPSPVTPEGWPTYSTGPVVTASEHFTMYASYAETADRSRPTARMRAGFSRLSQCWPWMRMGRHPLRDATLFGRMHSHKGLAGTQEVPPETAGYEWTAKARRKPGFAGPPTGLGRRSYEATR